MANKGKKGSKDKGLQNDVEDKEGKSKDKPKSKKTAGKKGKKK